MDRHADVAFRINPYTRWVYDHPERLLPQPTPELLAEARAKAGRAEGTEVDLGCGSGNFLLQRAIHEPRHHHIGFELRFKRLVKSARKLEKDGLTNVWLLREAAERFADYFPPASVDRIYVHFPDPWPRPSQWKKRLIGQGFLSDLHRALKPGGELRLKTDHSGYFLHFLGLIQGVPGWQITEFSNDLHAGAARIWRRPSRLPRALEPNLETEFEQLFRSKRKAVYSLVLEKVAE
jgi:tRNA (guanine-N7-)-methyltransferase